MTGQPDRRAEVERQLEDLSTFVRAAAGTGDGIVSPEGPTEALDFAAALDARADTPNSNRRFPGR